ncbi:MAG TPA: SpoIIE family protein phosphatase [Acidobacteriaceae bacterium]|nr:SpoIIE family protein phosphatase [Acidobacteriaceae bacterium]
MCHCGLCLGQCCRGGTAVLSCRPSPLLLIRKGSVIETAENGLMLANFAFATYETLSYPVRPGDRLMLYTDGVVEAEDARRSIRKGAFL